jgi:hypothetical protein
MNHTHTHHTQHTNTHTCSDERKHESVWMGKDPQAWQRSAVLVRILGWLYYLVTDRQRAFIYGHGISQSPSSVEMFIASIRNGFFTLSVHINEILRSWKSLPSRGATCPSATPLLTPNPHTHNHTQTHTDDSISKHPLFLVLTKERNRYKRHMDLDGSCPQVQWNPRQPMYNQDCSFGPQQCCLVEAATGRNW